MEPNYPAGAPQDPNRIEQSSQPAPTGLKYDFPISQTPVSSPSGRYPSVGMGSASLAALPVKSKSPKTALIVMIIVGAAAVALAGGGGWYYYDSLPKKAFAAMPAKMAAIESASYKVKLKVSASPKSDKLSEEDKKILEAKLKGANVASIFGGVVRILNPADSANAQALFSQKISGAGADTMMPSALPDQLKNLVVELRASGSFKSRTNSSPNFSTLFDFNISGAAPQPVGLGAEFRSIDDTYYFRLTELPVQILPLLMQEVAPFQMLNPTSYLKNWYSLKAKTLADLKLQPSPADTDEVKIQAARERVNKLIAKSKLFDITSTARGEYIDNVHVYRYVLAPRIADLKTFLREVKKIQEDRDVTKTEEQQIDDLVSQLQNAEIDEWIDADSHHLRKLEVSLPNYPYDRFYLNADMTIEFTDVNQAEVNKPASVIPFDDEFKKFVGSTWSTLSEVRTTSQDARRITDIKQTELALELYYDANNKRYPSSLSALMAKSSCLPSSVEEYSKCLPLAPLDPTDQTPYRYSPRASASGSNKYDSYHLGASLENPTNPALGSDQDCNSITGVKCPYRSGYNRATAFDGTDTRGCNSEINRYCYDITPRP